MASLSTTRSGPREGSGGPVRPTLNGLARRNQSSPLEPILSAASFPPLHKTQGRGTHRFGAGNIEDQKAGRPSLRDGGWPRFLILQARPRRWVPRPFALFAEGRVPPTHAQGVLGRPNRAICSIVPALVKNARTGHPLSRIKNGEESEGRATRQPLARQSVTPRDPETKSWPIPHSLAPARPLRANRNDNCSISIVPSTRPVPASPDCDAYTAASLRASLWSKH